MTEVLFAASFVLLALGSTEALGLQGATFAFLMNYCLYFLFLLWLFGRYFRGIALTDRTPSE